MKRHSAIAGALLRDFRSAHLQPQWIRVKELSLAKATALSKFFDNFLGVSDVITAQKEVQVAESDFLSAREDLQTTKDLLREKSSSLKETRKRLDRCSRDDENYLSYVAEEHQLLLEEKDLRTAYEQREERERDLFASYASSVRVSHEQERARAERTKYWSIIGSISGTVLGFVASSLLTYYRFKQIRDLASASGLSLAVSELKGDIEFQGEQSAKIHEKLTETTDLVLNEINSKTDMLKMKLEHVSLPIQSKVISADNLEVTEIPVSILSDQILNLGSNVTQQFNSLETSLLEEIDKLKLNLSVIQEKNKPIVPSNNSVDVVPSNNSVDVVPSNNSVDVENMISSITSRVGALEDQSSHVLTITAPRLYDDYWLQKANFAVSVAALALSFYSAFLRSN